MRETKVKPIDRKKNPLLKIPTFGEVIINDLTRLRTNEKLYKRLYKVCEEYKEASIGLCEDSEFINVMKELESIK